MRLAPPPSSARVAAAIAAVVVLLAGCALEPDVTARRAEPVADLPLVSTPTTAPPDTTPPPDPPPPTSAPPSSTPPSSGPTPGTTPGGEPTMDPPMTNEPAVPSIEIDVDIADVAEVGDDKTDRPYDDFVAASLLDIEEWLDEVYPEVHGSPWIPLRGGVFPAYPGRTDIPGCGEPTTDYRDVTFYVAFYCAGGDFMVYDDGDDSLLGELAAEFGNSVLGVVLAHEYAHAVQDRTGDLSRRLPTILTEQQADCMAGAWVGRADSGGSRYLSLTEADIRGALIAMVAVRDPVGTNQFDEGGHGSAFDRIGAFQEGYLEGPARCAELLDDPLPLMPNEFQTTTDMLNDGDLPFGYDEGQIVPLIVGTLNGFWPFQLDELGAGSFAPMSLVPVDSASEVACSGRPRVVAPGLATCAEDAVVYMDDSFARRLYNDPIVGSADFAVGYFVALGWADVVQSRLGSTLTGAERALANDCLVGAWARDLDPDRPNRPDETDNRGIISPGDLDEAVVAAIEIGDADSADDLLGTPFDKIDAFRSGVLGQIEACLPRLDP